MSGFLRMREASSAKAVSRTWWLPFSIRQWARIHSFQRRGIWFEAEEIQKTTSVVCAQSPVAGARLQTVRSNRSTVLISFSQGVSRNQALAGRGVGGRVPTARVLDF